MSMDKPIHDIRYALDIIIVCTYMQEDETEKENFFLGIQMMYDEVIKRIEG